MTEAPLGGKKTGKNPTDRAQKGTQRFIRTDGRGVPLGAEVRGANRPDGELVDATLGSNRCLVRPPRRGPPSTGVRARRTTTPAVRELVAAWGYTAHIRMKRKRGQEAIEPEKVPGLPRPAAGGRANPPLDEPIPTAPHPLGEEGAQLQGVYPPRLCLDHLPGRWGFGIGSYRTDRPVRPRMWGPTGTGRGGRIRSPRLPVGSGLQASTPAARGGADHFERERK